MGLGTLTAGMGVLVPGLGVHASTLGVLTAGLQGGGAPTQSYSALQWTTVGYQDTTAVLSDQRVFAMVVTNRLPIPATHLTLWGRNYISGHGAYLGAWVIGGTLNLSTYNGTTYQRITFSSGADTFTPPNGSTTSPALWFADRIALDTPIPVGESRIIRIQATVGSYATSLGFKTGSRPNAADIGNFARSNSAGDFGSTLALVQTNPGSWNAGIQSVVNGGVLLEAVSETATRRAIVFGDSIIQGYVAGNSARDTWVDAAKDAMGAGYDVVSNGLYGYLIQDSVSNVSAFLASQMAQHFETVILSTVSWNNRNQTSSTAAQTALNSAITAIQAAGKRVVLWVPVPACVVGGNLRWDEMLSWTRSRGLPYIETWQNVAENGVGPMLVPAYTGDNVHLLTTGQAVQGADLGAQRSVIFP